MAEPQDNPKPYEELLQENEQLKKRLDSYAASKKAKWSFLLWVSKRVVVFFVGRGLKGSLVRLYEELPDKVQKETLADVTTHVVWRFTRIGIFAMLAALIPIGILVTQTVILNRQNQLIDKQNIRLDQQTNLAEATRRGSLVFLMSNILDKMDEELKDPDNKERKLSKELIGRIVALNEGLKPYLYLENDTLIESPLSPERGQLLLSLVKSGLDSSTLREIYKNTAFNEADLKNLNLEYANLHGANLEHIDLRGAVLRGANLQRVDFSEANLQGADLAKADLREAELYRANLQKAGLNKVDLHGVWLSGANLEHANLNEANLQETKMLPVNLRSAGLRNANLQNSWLKGSNLQEAWLLGANLKGAWLEEVNLEEAYLSRANLQSANLKKANLQKAWLKKTNFRGADLENADLREAKVYELDWLQTLKRIGVKGIENIISEYYVDGIPQIDEYGGTYYLVKKRK